MLFYCLILIRDGLGNMSNAELFLSQYVQVEHYTPDLVNSQTEGYIQDVGLQAVKVNIQPASAEIIALNNGAMGKTYTVFTTNSGILHTDRITTVSGVVGTPNGIQYIVKGRNFFNYG